MVEDVSGTKNGQIHIKSVWSEPNEKANRHKLASKISIDDVDKQSEIEIFFEVPTEYASALVDDRCDAFVVLILHRALSKGYNIVSDVPMSSDLLFNIKEFLLPALMNNGPYRISIDIPKKHPMKHGKGVGTGLSCGVDSFHAIKTFINYNDADFKLTHLCINDVGAFNAIYESPELAKKESYKRSSSAAEMIGLPLIKTYSNADLIFHQNHYLTHFFSSLFAVMCMGKLFKTYIYASAGHPLSKIDLNNWWNKDSDDYELLLLRYFSTRSLQLYSAGEMLTRLEKIEIISDYDVAKKHLYSCTYKDKNCGICDKCIRNLTALDAIGKLDEFSNVYDIEKYKEMRLFCLNYAYNRKDDQYFGPIINRFIKNNEPDVLRIKQIRSAIVEFDELWASSDSAMNKKAVQLLEPYTLYSVSASFRIMNAYRSGKGVPKDLEKAALYHDFIEDTFRRELGWGIAGSGLRLFDMLWSEERYDELMATIKPIENNPGARYRLAKMLFYGKGIEMDKNNAKTIMKALCVRNKAFEKQYLEMFGKEQ